MWVDKGSDIYNRSMKSSLEKDAIEMYSIHSEGKPVVVERFIKLYRVKFGNTRQFLKNVYIDKLDEIVNKY